MVLQCPGCTERFSDSTAICFDSADPHKANGCPHCGTFYLYKHPESRASVREYLRYGLINAVFTLPAIYLVGHYYRSASNPLLFNLLIILLAAGGVILFDYLTLRRTLIKSPWQPSALAEVELPGSLGGFYALENHRPGAGES